MKHFKELLEAKDEYKKMLNAAKKKIKGLDKDEACKVIDVNFPSYADKIKKDLKDAGLISEARVHRAIFFYDGTESQAERCAAGKLFDYADSQENVTIESVNAYEGDTEDEAMIHFVGMAQYPEKNWKQLVKEVEKKFPKLSFERFA